tara:strand:- start:962 stop:1336 length:375 start_codon:yes stop_codon:yes gene_type:complete
MFKYITIFVSLFFLAAPNVNGNEVSAEMKIKLQNLMNNFIEDISVDGKMIYIDTKSDKLNGLYFSSAHPMYVPHEGNFFLCTAGVDDEGNEHLVDFYAKEVNGDYKIVDVSVDNRDTTKAILGM